jgi:hypothetical protein
LSPHPSVNDHPTHGDCGYLHVDADGVRQPQLFRSCGGGHLICHQELCSVLGIENAFVYNVYSPSRDCARLPSIIGPLPIQVGNFSHKSFSPSLTKAVIVRESTVIWIVTSVHRTGLFMRESPKPYPKPYPRTSVYLYLLSLLK